MKRIPILPIAAASAAGIIALVPFTAGGADDEAAPIFGVKMPPGYRDWRLISVAHEAGNLNDLRAILGNDVAIMAYREGRLPFPDGTIIARLAWGYVPSAENNVVFGRIQSFVAGPPKEGVQFMVKDSKKYASTGGWGFAQFDGGKPASGGAQHLLPLPRGCERARFRLYAVGAMSIGTRGHEGVPRSISRARDRNPQ
ncbi:MAG: cytochrome P460 family protein [Rhodomicrobium sp.]